MSLMVFEVVLILKIVIESMWTILFSKIKTLVHLQHKKFLKILFFSFLHLRFIIQEVLCQAALC